MKMLKIDWICIYKIRDKNDGSSPETKVCLFSFVFVVIIVVIVVLVPAANVLTLRRFCNSVL